MHIRAFFFFFSLPWADVFHRLHCMTQNTVGGYQRRRRALPEILTEVY
ncbi:unnamed protein product [Amoebophrya sp. A25]|nr:unnamed protein product [Amoebophrya sp. A25]|eukprot:GSA25T00023427001.1